MPKRYRFFLAELTSAAAVIASAPFPSAAAASQFAADIVAAAVVVAAVAATAAVTAAATSYTFVLKDTMSLLDDIRPDVTDLAEFVKQQRIYQSRIVRCPKRLRSYQRQIRPRANFLPFIAPS